MVGGTYGVVQVEERAVFPEWVSVRDLDTKTLRDLPRFPVSFVFHQVARHLRLFDIKIG